MNKYVIACYSPFQGLTQASVEAESDLEAMLIYLRVYQLMSYEHGSFETTDALQEHMFNLDIEISAFKIIAE